MPGQILTVTKLLECFFHFQQGNDLNCKLSSAVRKRRFNLSLKPSTKRGATNLVTKQHRKYSLIYEIFINKTLTREIPNYNLVIFVFILSGHKNYLLPVFMVYPRFLKKYSLLCDFKQKCFTEKYIPFEVGKTALPLNIHVTVWQRALTTFLILIFLGRASTSRQRHFPDRIK